MTALLKGFGPRPFAVAWGWALGPGSESLVRGKPRGGGALFGGAHTLWGFEDRGRIEHVAAGAKAAGVMAGSRHGGLLLGRGCGWRMWARSLESVCGGREDTAWMTPMRSHPRATTGR